MSEGNDFKMSQDDRDSEANQSDVDMRQDTLNQLLLF
jgi:hypothetical protein